MLPLFGAPTTTVASLIATELPTKSQAPPSIAVSCCSRLLYKQKSMRGFLSTREENNKGLDPGIGSRLYNRFQR
jgi:hypothetical protein